MRWSIAVVYAGTASACGRLAFDELAVTAPDATGDGPAPATCTTMAFDEFPSDMVEQGGGTLQLMNGQVTFKIPGTVDIDVYIELATATSFVGRSTAVQVVSPSPTPGASTAFGWHVTTGDLLGTHMEMDGNNLKLNQYNPTLDKYSELVSVPYDAVEHAWWQMRDGGGRIIAEVSRDGVTWNPFGAVEDIDLSSMKWDLGAGSYVTSVPASESVADTAVNCVP